MLNLITLKKCDFRVEAPCIARAAGAVVTPLILVILSNSINGSD